MSQPSEEFNRGFQDKYAQFLGASTYGSPVQAGRNAAMQERSGRINSYNQNILSRQNIPRSSYYRGTSLTSAPAAPQLSRYAQHRNQLMAQGDQYSPANTGANLPRGSQRPTPTPAPAPALSPTQASRVAMSQPAQQPVQQQAAAPPMEIGFDSNNQMYPIPQAPTPQAPVPQAPVPQAPTPVAPQIASTPQVTPSTGRAWERRQFGGSSAPAAPASPSLASQRARREAMMARLSGMREHKSPVVASTGRAFESSYEPAQKQSQVDFDQGFMDKLAEADLDPRVYDYLAGHLPVVGGGVMGALRRDEDQSPESAVLRGAIGSGAGAVAGGIPGWLLGRYIGAMLGSPSGPGAIASSVLGGRVGGGLGSWIGASEGGRLATRKKKDDKDDDKKKKKDDSDEEKDAFDRGFADKIAQFIPMTPSAPTAPKQPAQPKQQQQPQQSTQQQPQQQPAQQPAPTPPPPPQLPSRPMGPRAKQRAAGQNLMAVINHRGGYKAAEVQKEAARGDHFAALLRGSLKAMKNPEQTLTLSPKLQQMTGVTKPLPIGRMGPGPSTMATTGPHAGIEPFTAKDMMGLARTRARDVLPEYERVVARGRHPRVGELKGMLGELRSPEMRGEFVSMMDGTYYKMLAELAKSMRGSGIKPIYKG